ncbi:MAG: hypothetical protein IIZ27_01650 [Solobacterium sp.]|nr:hypothetical protein [Solobacterium sp.]
MLVCFGSHCIDRYHFPEGEVSYAGGGSVNCAVHAQMLGIPAAFAGSAGNDKAGELILRELKRYGADLSHVHIVAGNSAVCDVFVSEGERILGDYDDGVNDGYSLTEEDLRFIASADYCLCDLWGPNQKYFPVLKKLGAVIAYDCADRDETDPRVREALPYTDIVFFSSGQDDPVLRQRMLETKQKGPAIVAATLGEHGSIVLSDDGFTVCPACTVTSVTDTMGAGDAYAAGFLAGLYQKKSIPEAMAQGSREAAQTLSYHGAFPQEGDPHVYQ